MVLGFLYKINFKHQKSSSLVDPVYHMAGESSSALLITPSSAKASARTVGWRDPGFSDCLPQGAVAKHQVNFSLFLLWRSSFYLGKNLSFKDTRRLTATSLLNDDDRYYYKVGLNVDVPSSDTFLYAPTSTPNQWEMISKSKLCP